MPTISTKHVARALKATVGASELSEGMPAWRRGSLGCRRRRLPSGIATYLDISDAGPFGIILLKVNWEKGE
jgi:hypothetical protein